MKKQNAQGFGARSASPVYYVVVPTGVSGGVLEVGPIVSKSAAHAYAKGVSLHPSFQGRRIGVKRVAA
jgi:hypothetical protein